jgi:hypothetical protein
MVLAVHIGAPDGIDSRNGGVSLHLLGNLDTEDVGDGRARRGQDRVPRAGRIGWPGARRR